MFRDELEEYESEIELELYREYRDVIAMFRYVVETERRFYLANEIVRTSAPGDALIEYTLRDCWVWDMYRKSRFLSSAVVASSRGVTVEELPSIEL